MIGHNDAKTLILVWILPNVSHSVRTERWLIRHTGVSGIKKYRSLWQLTGLRIWIAIPFIVSIVLGRFVTRGLQRDLASQISYKEWADLRDQPEETAEKGEGSVLMNGTARLEGENEDATNGTSTPTSTSKTFLAAQGGAALPITLTPRHLPVLIVGSNRLAATRALSLIEADADVYVASSCPLSGTHSEIQHRVKQSEVRHFQLDMVTLQSWAVYLSEHDIALVCVTDTLIGTGRRRSLESAELISKACIALHIPVNISDHPSLSTYSFPSVHRFTGIDGQASNLQVAVSTNGHGCRLSGRIKREIVSKLPSNVGAAVDNVGQLRARAKHASKARLSEEDDPDTPLNSPVPQLDTPSLLHRASMELSKPKANDQEQQLRRMRWVHQMSEYYSYEALARMTASEMDKALATWDGDSRRLPHHEAESSTSQGKGRIFLVGSGPGHPGLLTVSAQQALESATLVFSDKLVPAEILALIPASTKLHIAKKFPGNNEGAQNEMMELALEGARAGERVVRLKQGDPFVYGRGGEEVLYFRENGFEATIIPGVSSALAGPLMVGIPVTQRGVAESLVLCTGVGRKGKSVQLPGYIKSRTLVVLMGVARMASIVSVLTDTESTGRDGAVYPSHLPIALIERASSPDQRVILSTLEGIEEALKSVEERPPGMMVIGWAALCLEGEGRVDVLDGADEKKVIEGWMKGERWKVREGLHPVWDELLGAGKGS